MSSLTLVREQLRKLSNVDLQQALSYFNKDTSGTPQVMLNRLLRMVDTPENTPLFRDYIGMLYTLSCMRETIHPELQLQQLPSQPNHLNSFVHPIPHVRATSSGPVLPSSISVTRNARMVLPMLPTREPVPVRPPTNSVQITVPQNSYPAGRYNIPPGLSIGSSVSISTVPSAAFPKHPPIKLEENPFYVVTEIIVPPTNLRCISLNRQTYEESVLSLKLNSLQCSRLSQDKNVEIQMRFCVCDTNGVQTDCYPMVMQVHINGNVFDLPKPNAANLHIVEPRPLYITRHCVIKANFENKINIRLPTNIVHSFCATIRFVRKMPIDGLLKQVIDRTKRHKSKERTLGMIKEKLRSDSEIATTSLRVLLSCPLSKLKMNLPCRASTCSHLQCFDLLTFLKMNEKKPTWECPVCNKAAAYNHLTVDNFFECVIRDAPKDAKEVELNAGGKWKVVDDSKENSTVNITDSTICLDDSDDESTPVKRQAVSSHAAAPSLVEVINLDSSCNSTPRASSRKSTPQKNSRTARYTRNQTEDGTNGSNKSTAEQSNTRKRKRAADSQSGRPNHTNVGDRIEARSNILKARKQPKLTETSRPVTVTRRTRNSNRTTAKKYFESDSSSSSSTSSRSTSPSPPPKAATKSNSGKAKPSKPITASKKTKVSRR